MRSNIGNMVGWEIKDELKRAFALGFEYLFERQSAESKKTLAAKAGVDSTALTYITRGPENKFPGYPVQVKIASFFGLDHHEVLRIGREIEAGRDVEIDIDNTLEFDTTDDAGGVVSKMDLIKMVGDLREEIGRLKEKLARYEQTPQEGDLGTSPQK